MSAHASVLGHRRPLVAQHFHVRTAGIHHRLDGNDHSDFQFHSPSPLAKVRHLRVFVHVDADSMAHKISHHREALGLSTSCTAAPTSPSVAPGFTAAIPAWSDFSVTASRRAASGSIEPTGTVIAASPK